MNQTQIKATLYSWLFSQLGTRKEFTITFGTDFVTGNVINGTFGVDVLNAVSFNADQATTLEALRDEIQKTGTIFKCYVSGSRQLTCVVNAVGTSPVVVGPTVSGGASQPVATVAQTVAAESVTVIFDDQNAPRPNGKYATIRLDSMQKIGWDENRETDQTTFITTIGGQRRATVAINYFGSDAFTEISKAFNSLEKESVRVQLYSSGIAIGEKNSIQNISQLLESEWEERSFFDFYILFADNFEDDLGVITTAEIGGEVTGGATGSLVSGPEIVGV